MFLNLIDIFVYTDVTKQQFFV